MPILSNGGHLSVTADAFPQMDDIAYNFTIDEPDGTTVGPQQALANYFFGSVSLASVDVFDGFFAVTGLTYDGKYKAFVDITTNLYDNAGNFLRSVTVDGAYNSMQFTALTATTPSDLTLQWIGANGFGTGMNAQYGPHQLQLVDGVAQPFTFDNHTPVVTGATYTIAQGQALPETAFAGSDADADMLTYVIVGGPQHGMLDQQTVFDSDYPFPTGDNENSPFGPFYHYEFLSGNHFSYVPDAGFSGQDSFTVYATDGTSNSAPVTITLNVLSTNQYITLGGNDDTVSYSAYDHAVLVAANGGNDSITGSKFNDSLNGGTGNDALRGGDGKDTITGGIGADRVQGGAGNDTFVFRTGDIATSGIDHIIDFHGAGTSGIGEQDFIQFKGFDAGTTLVFDHYGTSAAQQYYKIIDTLNPATGGLILIQMADGTHILTAADYGFYG